MNTTSIVISASLSLALFSLFKYGFIYLTNRMMIAQENKIIRMVVDRYGKEIADRIAKTVSNSVSVAWKEKSNDYNKSEIFPEARGSYYKKS